MIEACTGLVPIFGFIFEDVAEEPRTGHRRQLVAGPRDDGSRMGRSNYMARLQRRRAVRNASPKKKRTKSGAHPERAHTRRPAKA